MKTLITVYYLKIVLACGVPVKGTTSILMTDTHITIYCYNHSCYHKKQIIKKGNTLLFDGGLLRSGTSVMMLYMEDCSYEYRIADLRQFYTRVDRLPYSCGDN